jgi:methylphosphotriester-DNA--protein-cysteine methyltransferase
MEHYNSEREWLKHMGKETKYSSQQLKKLYKAYYKLSPQKRFSMSFNWERITVN